MALLCCAKLEEELAALEEDEKGAIEELAAKKRSGQALQENILFEPTLLPPQKRRAGKADTKRNKGPGGGKNQRL